MSWRKSPWIAALVLAAAALAPVAVPSWARFRLLGPKEFRQAFLDPFQRRPRIELVARRPRPEAPKPDIPLPAPTPGAELAGTDSKPSLRALPPTPPAPGEEALLLDPHNALKGFHEALARVERGDGLARVLHFGDSVVTGDLITGEARTRFQKSFGDGGPGWIYPQRPWEWYGRPGLTLKGEGWRIQSPVLVGRKDHLYGLGDIAFASQNGAETLLSTGKSQSFSTLEVHYLAQPKGGRIRIKVDKATDLELGTAGESRPAVKSLPMPSDQPHTLNLRPVGETLVYGLVLERKGPGVVYDAIGSNGGAIQHLARVEAQNWIEALRLRRPDLVILAYGTNEVGYYNIPGPAYAADYREVVRRIREALPAASILVMGPMDRGERTERGEIGTMPNLVRIVAAQKKIASELGVAFFDSYRAMGGEGAAGRWYLATPRLMTGDFTHPTRTGADRLARLLVEALQTRYQAFRDSARPQQHPAPAETGAKGSHRR
jgi:lysophospholipase L1-like esterase